jgi:hypothetical protein
VFNAICASYDSQYEPEICKDGLIKPLPHTFNWTIVIIILSILLVSAILIIYRLWLNRELKNDMKIQVGNAVAQYFHL